MPRDAQGVATLPEAPFSASTVAVSARVNNNLSDIAAMLTGSLARNGAGAMTGPLDMGGQALLNGGALNGASINGGALAGLRNLVINANPIVNQRGYVSGAATAFGNQYTLDRWRVVVSGQNLSWTDSLGVRTVTFPAGGGEQVVEGLSILGGVHTLSWAGTATATVGAGAVSNGGQATLTGGSGTIVRFSGGTASQIMLEPGAQATPFERRSIGVEVMLCQRYYQTGNIVLGFGSFAPGAAHIYPMRLTPMRATASIQTSASSLSNVSSVINSAPTNSDFAISVVATSSGNCSCLVGWTADAEL